MLNWCQFWCKWCQKKVGVILKKTLDKDILKLTLNEIFYPTWYVYSTKRFMVCAKLYYIKKY